jgi:multidrug efflux pump
VVYVYLDKLRRRKPDEHELVRHPLENQPSITTNP